MSRGKTVPGFSLNSFIAPAKDWYKDLTFEDALDMAKEKIVEVAEDFVSLGYYLKYIWDKELYIDKGYRNIWECAEVELHLTQSTASRYINMCKKFSKNGDSPYLDDRFKEFGKSQLQEMLTIDSKELTEKIKPNMSIRQIKTLKKKANIEKATCLATEERKDRFSVMPRQFEVTVEGTYREFKANETDSELAQQKKEENSDFDKNIGEEHVCEKNKRKKSKTVLYSEFSFDLLPLSWSSINKIEDEEGIKVTFWYE